MIGKASWHEYQFELKKRLSSIKNNSVYWYFSLNGKGITTGLPCLFFSNVRFNVLILYYQYLDNLFFEKQTKNFYQIFNICEHFILPQVNQWMLKKISTQVNQRENLWHEKNTVFYLLFVFALLGWVLRDILMKKYLTPLFAKLDLLYNSAGNSNFVLGYIKRKIQ